MSRKQNTSLRAQPRGENSPEAGAGRIHEEVLPGAAGGDPLRRWKRGSQTISRTRCSHFLRRVAHASGSRSPGSPMRTQAKPAAAPLGRGPAAGEDSGHHLGRGPSLRNGLRHLVRRTLVPLVWGSPVKGHMGPGTGLHIEPNTPLTGSFHTDVQLA